MKFLCSIAILLFGAVSVPAVILFETGDPNTNDPSMNTTAPTGPLVNSGWQFEGDWGAFLGTPFAPQYFISAAHIGQAGDNFSYAGSTYTIAQSYALGGGSDLLIWRVREIFPTFAPLYTRADEPGQHLVVIGRGTERGGPIYLNNTFRGWSWGPWTAVRRWGENDVYNIFRYQNHDLVHATFDANVSPNESHLSSGDSGGAVFLNDNRTWKLAGINYSVDDLYTAPDPNTAFNAALFDARGYYTTDNNIPPNYVLITGDSPVPSGFYASRISSELAWIGSVIAEPQVGRDGNFLTLTYTRITAPATDVAYSIEESIDGGGWQPATTQDQVISTNGDLQIVSSKVDVGTAHTLLLHLVITRP